MSSETLPHRQKKSKENTSTTFKKRARFQPGTSLKILESYCKGDDWEFFKFYGVFCRINMQGEHKGRVAVWLDNGQFRGGTQTEFYLYEWLKKRHFELIELEKKVNKVQAETEKKKEKEFEKREKQRIKNAEKLIKRCQKELDIDPNALKIALEILINENAEADIFGAKEV